MVSKKKIQPFHAMPRYLLAKILEGGKPATRVELEVLFLRHCVGDIMEQHVLDYFKNNELQRLIVLELYRANVIVRKKDRMCVIKQLAEAIGIHHKTAEKWTKAEFHESEN